MEFGGIEAGSLIVASAFGVAINTITGGGSLITLPVLLAVGLPLKQSLAVNMIGLAIGGAGSVVGGLESLKRNPRTNFLILLPTVLGASIGAALLVRIPLESLKLVIPVLVLLSTLSLFYTQRKWHIDNAFLAYLSVFFASVYGGFFGAGMGVILLSVLTIFGYGEIHIITSLKNIQQVVINSISAIVLLSGGLVLLKPTLFLVLGGLMGGYTTGRYLEHVSGKKLRVLMIAVGLFLSAVLAATVLVN
jgi:uncharacterized membrane protein YfcA